MDSSPEPRPLPAVAPPDGAPAVSPTVLGRVQRLVPYAQRAIGAVRVVGVVSAMSTAALWALLVHPWMWMQGAEAGSVVLALGVLVVLLVPAGAAFLGVLTLGDVLALPGRLRLLATETADHARSVVTPGEVANKRRAFGFFQAIWSARALVLDSKGAWLKAVALARLGRLASLPFALLLLGLFALNFVVIAAAGVAVLLVIVF